MQAFRRWEFSLTKSNDQTADLWQQAFNSAVAYRENVPEMPILPLYDAAEAHARFGGELDEESQSSEAVLAHILGQAEGGILQFTSPRFFGFVIGASHPVGVAADWMVSAWGNPTAYAEMSPATVAMENAVCTWAADLMGLPKNCGAGIVTGATIANTVGIMAARNALLSQYGWDVEADGLFGAPEVHVVVGEQAHSAVFAGLRYVGFGANRVTKVATDDQARILPDAMERALENLSGPILVILQAGSINSGDSDPFADLIPMAKKRKAWVHVDGAFGLWLNAAPDTKHMLDGVEQADSWAVDLHKWLNAPYDSALVYTKDRAPLVSAMSATGAYLPEEGTFPNPSDSVMELSRRARGVPSYAILKTLGKNGVAEMVSRHCRLARLLGDKLRAEAGITILNEIASNQVAICCGEGTLGDPQTAQVLKMVQDRGKVFPTHGSWKGRTTIRASIIGHETQDEDIDLLANELIEAWRAVRKS